MYIAYKKIDKIFKGVWSIASFMHNFLYQYVSILLLFKLPSRRVETFWSEGIDTFLSDSPIWIIYMNKISSMNNW